MYELYKEECQEDNTEQVSSSAYRNVFLTKFNLGFGSPRSDTCSTCDVGIDEAHKTRAALAFAAQKADRQLSRSNSDIVFCTFDLQKTMPLPKLSTNVAFYLRQAWLYNLGIHYINGSEQKPLFFLWTEDQGRRGCEEVCSCILTFMHAVNISSDDRVIFWSDSCAGQNKNFFVLCLWQYLVGGHKVKCIDHKFPEPGHSYLDSDRDFAHIEKSVKATQNIYSVDEYQNIMTKSQRNHAPTVVRMADKFYNIKKLPSLLKLRNNTKATTGEKVAFRDKVKWIRVESFGHYLYKESHNESEPWKTVNLLSSSDGLMPEIDITCRPQQKIPLRAAKVKDIQKQLAFIPDVYRGFYTGLTSVSDTAAASENDDYSDAEPESNQLQPSDNIRSRPRSTQAKTAVKKSVQASTRKSKPNSVVSGKVAVSGSKRRSLQSNTRNSKKKKIC